MTTLRERQKIDTADRIRNVAVDLVYELGLDNVTAEMISDKVGISQRTFFNYFPYKEAALQPPDQDIDEQRVVAFLQGTGDVLDDLTNLIVPVPEFYAENRQMLRKLFEVSKLSPKLSMIKANTFQEFETKVKELIELRSDLAASCKNVDLLAALVVTCLRVAMENWAESDTGSPDEFIREAFTDLQTLFNR